MPEKKAEHGTLGLAEKDGGERILKKHCTHIGYNCILIEYAFQ
jgi:hypothetical protein